MEDWPGCIIAGFLLVWVANVYMSLFGFIRPDIKKEKAGIAEMEKISGSIKNEYWQQEDACQKKYQRANNFFLLHAFTLSDKIKLLKIK